MRLLILAYDFPPNGSIGGQRPYSWFKYFKEFGIHPVVVTRHWDMVVTPEDTIRPCGTEVTVTESEEGTIIRVPFRPNLRDRMLLRYGNRFAVLRKVLSLWFTLAQYFLPWADNRRNMLDAARSYFMENPCDAIIATGEPFILFRYAQMLSKEFGTPWVADYRDGWSTNYHLQSNASQLQRELNELLYQSIEKRAVSTCAQITCATPVLQHELASLHPRMAIRVIFNGYFPELFENLRIDENRIEAPFLIGYSGTLYPYQKLELFLDGVSLFIKTKGVSPSNLQLLFVGMDYQTEAKERLKSSATDLLPFIRTTPRLAAIDAIGMLSRCDFFVLLASRDFSPIPAKLFDYLALNKPILMCENDCSTVEEILNETGHGLIADSPEEVCKHINSIYDRKFIVTRSKGSDKFSRKHQASVLAELLKEMART